MKTYCVMLLATVCFVPAVFADPYAFPITPASPEWGSLTIEERLAAMQVPESAFVSMTTGDVYRTFLTMPSNGDYMLSSSGPQHGFDCFLRERYNVVDALFGRDDAAKVLAREYLGYRVDETTCHDCEYQQQRSLTELLLCQYGIIAGLTPAEKVAVVKKAYDVVEVGAAQPDNCLWEGNAEALMCRIMQADEFQPFVARMSGEPDMAHLLTLGWGCAACIELAPEYIASASAQ